MNADALIESLERFPETLRASVAGLSDADWRFKPDAGSWSILEVVRHLGDEEVDDFPRRLDLTLHQPGADWPPIDPEGWARARNYNEDDPARALQAFCDTRAASIAWLRGLTEPNWDATHEHPKLGTMRAGDLLASWAVHDHLHLRQITKRRFQCLQAHAGDFRTAYAGVWGP